MKSIKTTHRIALSLIMALTLFSSCSNDDESSEITPESNTVAIPDVNFEHALIFLGIDTNGYDGTILISDAEVVTELDLPYKDISSFEGIRAFTNLEKLICNNNYLVRLDVSNNLRLAHLNCASNEITELILIDNMELVSLKASSNYLKALDVSNNTRLAQLRIDNNNLTSLNVKNGNNNNLSDFYAKSNSNLYCVNVDDASWSTSHWSDCIDEVAAFDENCK